jgi:hypothetical protein
MWKWLNEFFKDGHGNLSHSRFIAIIVCISATFFMWKITVTGTLNEYFFGLYLLYGTGTQTINKALDAWSGKRNGTLPVEK